MTFNCFTTLDGIQQERLERIIRLIQEEHPQILGMQELASTEARASLQIELKGLHWIFSDAKWQYREDGWHTTTRAAFIPMIAALAIAPVVLLLCRVLGRDLSCLAKIGLWGLAAGGALLLHPSVFLREIGLFWRAPCQLAAREMDRMGLAIGLEKTLFTDIQLLHESPFAEQGYTWPGLTSWRSFASYLLFSVRTWIQKVYLQPGYMVVSCHTQAGGRRFFVAVAHLATGVDNPKRLLQVQELLAVIAPLAEEAPVVLMMDGNTPPDSPEMGRLRQAGFLDCWELSNGNLPGHTWAARNPYTVSPLFCDPAGRLDYVGVFWKKGLATCVATLCDRQQPCSDHFGVKALFAPVW